MKSLSLALFVFSFGYLHCQQVISGPCSDPVYIDTPSGSYDNKNGVEFVNQTVGNSCTLIVPGGYTVNDNQQTYAITTTVNSTGIVQFNGANNRGETTVFGKIGESSFFLDSIIMFDNDVFFRNQVNVDNFIFTGNGVAKINHEMNVGAGGVTFSDPQGVLQLNENAVLNGSIYGSLTSGYLLLNNNSTINGNVSLYSLEFGSNSKIGSLGAGINGNLLVQKIHTNSGNIGISGNIELGNDAYIHTEKNILIHATGSLILNGPVSLKMDFSPLEAPKSPNDAFTVVLADQGGASGYQINVQTNDIRVPLVGSNSTPGFITVQGLNVGSPPTLPSDPTGGPWWSPLGSAGVSGQSTEALVSLLPTAYANPGTDLDFIEGQIGSPTLQGYLNNLYQLYPIPSLIGVAKESFNTTRQFQKIWLEHLSQERTRCTCSCDDEKKAWIDGFGYFGRQSNKKRGQGYRVNTWGLAAALDLFKNSGYCFGVGAGYAYSDLVKSQFVVKAPRTNTTKIHHYQCGAYGSYTPSCWFMDGGVSLEYKNYNGTRYIYLPNAHRKAHSKYHGGEYSAFLTSGCRCFYRGFEITPLATMIYSYLHQTSLRESGANVLNLRIKSQNYHFLQSGLGVKAAKEMCTCSGTVIPELHIIWLHDYINSAAKATARFSNLGGAVGYFSNTGPRPDDNTLNVGASVTGFYSSNLSLLLNCDVEVSRHYYDIQGLIKLSYVY